MWAETHSAALAPDVTKELTTRCSAGSLLVQERRGAGRSRADWFYITRLAALRLGLPDRDQALSRKDVQLSRVVSRDLTADAEVEA
jgi:hypothetical protein